MKEALCPLFSDHIENYLEVLDFVGGTVTGEPGEKLHRWEPTPNSINLWRQAGDANLCNTDGGQVLSPLQVPRSQGLSSLPPLVVGRKTLVVAGHMTTQNLDGKKICWVGGVAEYFVWLMWQTLWASNPLAVTKYYSLFWGSKSNLPMMNATWFLPSSKYRRLSFTKKFGSWMEKKLAQYNYNDLREDLAN